MIIKEIQELKGIVFNMLNLTNLYCIVLDNELLIKFINMSLLSDLGYKSHKDVLDKCWLDFIDDKDKNLTSTVNVSVANGIDGWEYKYREFVNDVITKNNKKITVNWFNSHINTEFNLIFSFGIKKEPHIYESTAIRDMYYDLIKKNRIMINSMRDAINLRDNIVETCKNNILNQED